jgi:hypothetical protein
MKAIYFCTVIILNLACHQMLANGASHINNQNFSPENRNIRIIGQGNVVLSGGLEAHFSINNSVLN